MTQQDLTRARFAATAERHAERADRRVAGVRLRLASLLPLRGDERAVDVGAGTGTLARALAPLVGEVVAVDLVPEMLEQGRRRSAEGARIEFLVGDALALPFPDASFDLAATLRTLHHLDDPSRAVLELARVTRPEGLVLVIDQLGSEDADEHTAHEWIERRRDPSHVRTLPEAELRGLLAAAGLEVERVVLEHEDWDLDGFLALAGTGDDAKTDIVAFASELVASGREAGIKLRAHDGGYAFTHRVGWFLARRPTGAT